METCTFWKYFFFFEKMDWKKCPTIGAHMWNPLFRNFIFPNVKKKLCPQIFLSVYFLLPLSIAYILMNFFDYFAFKMEKLNPFIWMGVITVKFSFTRSALIFKTHELKVIAYVMTRSKFPKIFEKTTDISPFRVKW